MSDAFATLSRFLDQFDQDVEGRSLEPMPPDVARQLASFARGELSENERSKVIKLLQANPDWVPLLAREVKGLRPDALGKS
jgi:hypothetical protein